MKGLTTTEMLSLRAGNSSVTMISSGNIATAIAVSGNVGGSGSHPGICHILQHAEAERIKHILRLAEAKAGIELSV